MTAYHLQIGDQMGRGVGLEPALRQAAPGAALVKEDAAHPRRIEEAKVAGLEPSARAAVQEHRRHAARRTARLDPETVILADLQMKPGLLCAAC